MKEKIILKKNSNILNAFILASIIFAYMIFLGPTQDTGDDAFLAWQLSRGNGELASFISPYLSLIISFLYASFPAAWWSLFSVFSGYVLLFTVYYVVFKQYRGIIKFTICLIWAIFVWMAIIEKINFTRTATAYALAGAILILQKIQDDKMRYNGQYILGMILLLIGGMCRFQAALLVMPFIFVVVAYKYFWNKNRKILEFCRILRKKILIFFGPILVLIMLAIFNNIYWNLKPEWKEYNYYNKVRSEIADYVEYYPTWEDGEEEYEKLGLKEKNDLDLLFTWVFVGDTDVYSIETLEGIKNMKLEIPIRERIEGMNDRIDEMLRTGKVLKWVVLYIFVYVLAMGKKVWMPALVSIFGAFSILFVFSFLGRMMLRVWEPTLLCAASVILVSFENIANINRGYQLEVKKKNKSFFKFSIKNSWVIGIIFICIIFWGIKNLQITEIPNFNQDRDNVTRERAEYINATKERIYILPQPLIHHPPNPSIFGIWEPIQQDFCSNYFALSNWEARTPYNMERLEKLNIDNPVKALFERTDTYSLWDSQVYEFLKCHYNKRITCSIVDFFKDTGPIVQYTFPIEKYDSDVKLDFDYMMEDIAIDEMSAVQIDGKVEVDSDVEAFYFNLKSEGETTSYRLNYDEEGHFYAILCDVDSKKIDSSEEIFFIVKYKNGDYKKVSAL